MPKQTHSHLLGEQHLFERMLPEDPACAQLYRKVLQGLAELRKQLGRVPRAAVGANRSTCIEQARELRRALLRDAAQLTEDTPSLLQCDAELHVRLFSEAVLLWLHFAAAGGKVLIDTIGASSLHQYPVDFDPTEIESREVQQALQRAFALDDETLARMRAKVDHLAGDLRLKRALASEIGGRLGLSQEGDGSCAPPRAVLALFRSLYGPVPVQPEDLGLVLTTSSLFFCLPFGGHGGLECADFGSRPTAQRRLIESFLGKVRRAAAGTRQSRFPAFGFFDVAALDSRLVDDFVVALSNHAATYGLRAEQCTRDAVVQGVTTMVSVLSVTDAQKYLVHDVWGHGWQALLCEFERLYREIDDLDAPLDGQFINPPSRSDTMDKDRGPETLNEQLESDLRHRLDIGMNLIVAECLADLIEYKHSRQVSPLPSSSLFHDCPLKLDLTLVDFDRIIARWQSPYRRLMGSGHFDSLLAPALEAPLSEALWSRGEMAAADRLLLALLSFEAALEGLLRRAGTLVPRSPRYRYPTQCLDLLAVVLGWFYEHNRGLVLWHLDELLVHEIWHSLHALEAELCAASAPPFTESSSSC